MTELPFAKLRQKAARLKAASRPLAFASSAQKNDALVQMAHQLSRHTDSILEANEHDLLNARKNARADAFIDRLTLSPGRIQKMADAILEVVALPDPVGAIDSSWLRPNGLRVSKQRIPLGAIGIIYESRPNVTSDATALCLKSGNAVLLKGGSDAFHSNQAIFKALREGLEHSSLDPRAHDAVAFVQTTEREAVKTMLSLSNDLDLVIPRGGASLIKFVTEHSRVPVIKHDQGICHIVVDGSARAEHVEHIILNAKTQRPGVCNAMEGLIVLESAITPHLGAMLTALTEAGVTLHLDETSMKVARGLDLHQDLLLEATPESYGQEFLALELAVRVVPDLDAAIAHIETYGSDHSEALLSSDWAQIQRFQREVNSSVVLINASTRFSDGGQLGLGAEIGISTSRMHAYGPMGLRELTTTKFVVHGEGQIRD